MGSQFDARKTTIQELIGNTDGHQLRVPYYQRGYSWKAEQVEAFLSDIGQFAEKRTDARSEEYFLGPIVLMGGPALENSLFIIDGQQRIATSQILLSAIRDAAHEWGVENSAALALAQEIQSTTFSSEGARGGARPTLKLGDLDQKYFHAAIQKYPRQSQLVPSNSSEGLIKSARNLADRWIATTCRDKTNPLTYLKCLFDSLMHHTALVLIEVNSDRQAMDVFERINCRGVELAETDLILHRLMQQSTAQTERKQIRSMWNQMCARLGADAPVQGYLRHMWSAKLGDIGSMKLYEITTQHLDANALSPYDFIYECDQFCQWYIHLRSPQSQALHHEGRDAVWAIYNDLRITEAIPLLLAAAYRLEKSAHFSRIARAVESLIVRHQIFAGKERQDLRRVLLSACKAVWQTKSKDDVAQNVIEHLRAIDPTDAEMRSGSQRVMQLNRREACHVLRQIQNQNVKGAYKSTATLEHIFPQSPSQGYSVARRKLLKPHLNHLGNLTLLTDNDNKRASNKTFGEKKKAIYEKAELEIAREIVSYIHWGPTSIFKRAAILANLASTRWVLK